MLAADVEVDRRDFTVRAAFAVGAGERLALFGPSGAGKTTLLEAIAGLVPVRRGRIELAGRVLTSTERPAVAVPPWRRGVGLLRQEPGLFPHLSVLANLRYARPGGGSGASGSGAPGRDAGAVAAALGIGDLLGVMPARLSGGQAHRVALGRLLLAECGALLLDEPYAGLDAALRRSLTDLVASVISERAVPAILVAHELADAQAFADRVAVLDRGALLQAGSPDGVVLRPASRRVAELVGYGGFVPLPARGGLPGLVVGVHPERVVPGADASRGVVLRGVVTAARPAGASWEVTMRVGEVETVTGETVLVDRAGVAGDGVVGGGVVVVARLAAPEGEGRRAELTVLDPPAFAVNGAALAPGVRA